MQTGEDLQGLRKIIDFTRLISLFILSIHFYFTCYQAFHSWGWTATVTDRVLTNIAKTGLFNTIIKTKLFALLFLCVSLIGAKGKKEERSGKRILSSTFWQVYLFISVANFLFTARYLPI